MALAVIITWIFNNTRGSLMLLHASANTVIGTVFLIQTGYVSLYLAYLVVAVLLTGATRGRLSYQQDLQAPVSSSQMPQGDHRRAC